MAGIVVAPYKSVNYMIMGDFRHFDISKATVWNWGCNIKTNWSLSWGKNNVIVSAIFFSNCGQFVLQPSLINEIVNLPYKVYNLAFEFVQYENLWY